MTLQPSFTQKLHFFSYLRENLKLTFTDGLCELSNRKSDESFTLCVHLRTGYKSVYDKYASHLFLTDFSVVHAVSEELVDYLVG